MPFVWYYLADSNEVYYFNKRILIYFGLHLVKFKLSVDV